MGLSGSGVVYVLCVLPSSRVMSFDPSGPVLSRSVIGWSGCLVCPPVMAMGVVMLVAILLVVMMVVVIHHGCR